MRECRVQPAELLSTPSLVTGGQGQGLHPAWLLEGKAKVILPRAIFDHGSAQLAWRGANLQVSQNRCWALASPPTHTRQFSRRDACGFMVGFIKDSGILRPLKSFCLSFVSVKTCGDWV